MRNLLITGFEPFDGYSINPSEELVKAIDGMKIGSFSVVGAVLPLDYQNAMSILAKKIQEYSPDIILCCGQANRAAISIERIAINAIDRSRPDNYENIPESDVIDTECPAAYFASIDPHPLVDALQKEEIPAFVSYHAGIYGCNWLLFQVLDQAAKGNHDAKATFIHFPPLPSQAIEKDKHAMATMELATMKRAIEVIIDSLSKT